MVLPDYWGANSEMTLSKMLGAINIVDQTLSMNFMMMVSALVLTGWQSMISKMESSRSSPGTTTLSVCLMVRSTIIESCALI